MGFTEDKTVTLTVYRFDPAVDSEARYDTFHVPERIINTAYALRYIFENFDPTLAYRHECQNRGNCLGCACLVNGSPTRLCTEPLVEGMVLDPLPQFPHIKDLVVDFSKRWSE